MLTYKTLQERGPAATYDDDNHAESVLLTGEKSSEKENDDSHGNSSKCEPILCVSLPGDDDHELDGESEEEEEVKLQESNVDLLGSALTTTEYICRTTNLVCKIASFHSQVCTDMLVNGPGKFIV